MGRPSVGHGAHPVESDAGDGGAVSGLYRERIDMRRRRARGTWFPIIGTGKSTAVAAAVRSFEGTFGLASADPFTLISPVTFDAPQEGGTLDNDDSLSDVIGSEYILQRIVGKAYVSRTATLDVNGNDNNLAVLVGIGFFVARANDSASGGGEDTPIGSATAAERQDNYSVFGIKTVREPWIWRRTWILGTAGTNRGITGVANSHVSSVVSLNEDPRNVVANYPASTALYGSVADGPHIDSRVKRRVSQDNRLFLAVTAQPWPLGQETDAALDMQISGGVELRIFGSLRKARNTSAF